MNQPNWKRFVLGTLLAATGAIVGANMSPLNVAHGEVRGTPEPPTFQAGSVPILREISSTLRLMDARLARLEIVAQKLQTAAARSAASETSKTSDGIK